MSRNGQFTSYWKPSPSPTPKPADASRGTPSPSRPLDLKGTVVSATSATSATSRGSKTSPERDPASPASTDSFPDSPIHKSTNKTWRSSSPRSPPPQKNAPSHTTAAVAPSRIIQDSDEDTDNDDSSRGSAESLFEAVRLGQSFAQKLSSSATPTPPLTKRRANTLVTSPLPLRRAKHARVARQPEPPRHKFDMKALLRHAEQEDATEAAARRVSDTLNANRRVSATTPATPTTPTTPTTAATQQQQQTTSHAQSSGAPGSKLLLGGFLDGVHDDLDLEDGSRAAGTDGAGAGAFASFSRERLRKAFDRTEVAAASESWYFFKEYFVPSPAKGQAFPQNAAAPGSRWAFLRDATMRQDYVAMGVLRQALLGGSGGSSDAAPRLPDELFVWALDEASLDPSPVLRREYAAVLRGCPDQVRRFVDAERVLRLFQHLGPRWESIDLSTHLEPVPTIDRPYPGHNWSALRALLRLLADLADCLSFETVACAVKIMLRLAIDSVVEQTPDLLLDYQDALRKLVSTVSSAGWSDFCYDAGSSLYNSIDKPSLRWQVLACMPIDVPACHDLRRRLASVMLLGDPEHARQVPGRQLAQGLTHLTYRNDFVMAPDTNYADLAALVNMLDTFIDDAGRHAVMRRPDAASAAKNITTAATAHSFDAEIDNLAQRLKVIGRGIDAAGRGHVTRLESKTALDRLQIRLTYAVRTRTRQHGKTIFDHGGGTGGGDEDGRARPKQQDIRGFFKRVMTKRTAR